MRKLKNIYCPQCYGYVMSYDGKATIPIDSVCRTCRKRIVYYPDIGTIEITKIPERTTGAGTRIWF